MIDHAKLTAPDVVQVLDVETVIAEYEQAMIELWPEWTGAGNRNDPLQRLVMLAAFLRLWQTAAINDAARASMVAWARKNDLEHLAANVGAARLLFEPGDPSSNPPKPPEFESDDALRQRAVIAPSAFNTAGAGAAYKFLALSAGATPSRVTVSRHENTVTVRYEFAEIAAPVRDISVIAPPDVPDGHVHLVVMSRQDDGESTTELLNQVEAAVSGDNVRPIADWVHVMPVEIVRFTVKASAKILAGVAADGVPNLVEGRLAEYLETNRMIGRTVALSGIHSALHMPAVMERVTIESPLVDVVCSRRQAPVCVGIEVTYE